MSDNDQISRSELLDRISILESEAQVAIIECAARNSVSEGRWIVAKMELEIVRRIVEDAPPVEQPMSAVEFFAEYRRMCEHIGRCAVCPIMETAVNPRTPCKYLAYAYPEEAVAIVEKWAKEHPERRSE